MTRAKSAVAASEGLVADASGALLGKGGNAVDAVVSGVFAAAGAAPGVLLGPVQILWGGAGLGLRAVDGPPDVADALALAVCHLSTVPLRRAVDLAVRSGS